MMRRCLRAAPPAERPASRAREFERPPRRGFGDGASGSRCCHHAEESWGGNTHNTAWPRVGVASPVRGAHIEARCGDDGVRAKRLRAAVRATTGLCAAARLHRCRAKASPGETPDLLDSVGVAGSYWVCGRRYITKATRPRRRLRRPAPSPRQRRRPHPRRRQQPRSRASINGDSLALAPPAIWTPPR